MRSISPPVFSNPILIRAPQGMKPRLNHIIAATIFCHCLIFMGCQTEGAGNANQLEPAQETATPESYPTKFSSLEEVCDASADKCLSQCSNLADEGDCQEACYDGQRACASMPADRICWSFAFECWRKCDLSYSDEPAVECKDACDGGSALCEKVMNAAASTR